MSTNTIAVIGVAAAGLLLLAAVPVWLRQRARKHQHHNKAENIRGETADRAVDTAVSLVDDAAASDWSRGRGGSTETPKAKRLWQFQTSRRSLT